MSPQKTRLLVTGAGGQLGRASVELLLEGGADVEVVAASRQPAKLGALAERGATLRHADFDRPESLAAAFAGVDAALIISTDQLHVPGARARQHRAALEAAVAAGVGHICYTSMPGPELAAPIAFAPDHVAMESALAAGKVPYTVLRNSWYAEDLLFLLPHVLASGTWFTAAGQGRIAYVARRDVARAAAAALAGAPANRALDISGPQLHTVEQIAALAGAVFDRPIKVVQVDAITLARQLSAQGVPDFYVPMAVMTDLNQAAGHFDVRSDAVEDLTGLAPQTLARFFLEHRAKFTPA